MASIGMTTALRALMVDDLIVVNCCNPSRGKVLRVRTSQWSVSNSEAIGTSFCRLAALSSSRKYQPLHAAATGNNSAVGGHKTLEMDCLHLKDITDEREEVKGRELTAAEVRKLLSPCLEALGAQHKEELVEAFLSFPNDPSGKSRGKELYYSGDSFTSPVLGKIKFSSIPQLRAHMVHGKLPLSLVFLLELGFPTSKVAELMSQLPCIASYSVEEKVKPIIDFILELGVLAPDVPRIVLKRPQLFGCSLEENIKPTVAILKELGVDSEGWVKILSQFPHILTYSVGKVQQVVGFLSSIGLSPKESGKALTRFPQIIGYSVKTKLQPFANYFNSIGVKDLRTLVSRSPQLLGLSLELNIKPTVLFFSDNGYTADELSTIILRFPQLLGLSTEANIRPKWDYFVEMGRDKSELVDFPQYFGYSLEYRIKPRYKALETRALSWSLNRMLTLPDAMFLKHLEKET